MEKEKKLAGAWGRFWAQAIDWLVVGMITMPIWMVGKTFFGFDDWMDFVQNSDFLLRLALVVPYLGYATYMVAKRGSTVGKDAYGFKVYKQGTKELITYREAAVRELVKIGVTVLGAMGGLVYFVNGLVIVFSKSKQGLHDRLVKTEVVKVRPATPLGKQVLIALGIVVYYVVVRMLFV